MIVETHTAPESAMGAKRAFREPDTSVLTVRTSIIAMDGCIRSSAADHDAIRWFELFNNKPVYFASGDFTTDMNPSHLSDPCRCVSVSAHFFVMDSNGVLVDAA
ncbi:hypothetical protein CH63R_03770 [Colletotrichum higginsianum IMI 349063]|uniref:Uncharacterized protein n=1 Tax=Colletotrichum higginsianum (strain IMI 349063) TaxID=759273 RepID=A0A1B7YHY0_COLHI|nr:hypothetical protein CH63R_03770 [Colletotrichum higginsianum IMI 349063]OBR11474.1 hypothetical protein CH63R_03770 [Colletotrichum higginsianum IMI 349063]